MGTVSGSLTETGWPIDHLQHGLLRPLGDAPRNVE